VPSGRGAEVAGDVGAGAHHGVAVGPLARGSVDQLDQLAARLRDLVAQLGALFGGQALAAVEDDDLVDDADQQTLGIAAHVGVEAGLFEQLAREVLDGDVPVILKGGQNALTLS